MVGIADNKGDTNKGEESSGSDEEDEEEFDSDEDEEEEDNNGEEVVDQEKLRAYEVQKLRYYFAVAECDSVATAAALYEQASQVFMGKEGGVEARR